MRIHELTEATQYSTYGKPVLDAFVNQLVDLMRAYVRSLATQNPTNNTSRNVYSTSFTKQIAEYATDIAFDGLKQQARAILGTDVDVQVSDYDESGRPLTNRGLAYKNLVLLSKSYFRDPIIKMINRYLDNIYYDNMESEGQSQIEVLNQYFKRSPLRANINNFLDSSAVNVRGFKELVSIFLHELAHINQHNRSIAQSGKTYYRSYLQKSPSEFNRAYRKDHQGQYLTPSDMKLMHVSSPEEIDANIQNLTLEIADLWGWDDIEDPNDVDITMSHPENWESYRSTIVNHVYNHMKGMGVTPDTPRTRMIYKRYLNRVYQECERYRKSVINRLKAQ